MKKLDDVVEVPSSAISNNGAQATITVVEASGRHVAEPITVGTTDDGETEIVRGVRAGQRIVDKVVTFTSPSGAQVGKGLPSERGFPSSQHFAGRTGVVAGTGPVVTAGGG